MYKITLTTGSNYDKIISCHNWMLDDNYFIFNWKNDNHIIIRKEFVLSIKKYGENNS